jgi:predicted HAD superfamily phosphohydrolase YqeG
LRAIQIVSSKADLAIVSQTPLEAIAREWEENFMINYIRFIAGQEQGTKTEHIKTAAKGKYPDNKILMIGDAIGDLIAARENNILFCPIIPGKEDKSWERFINEGFERFITGRFAGTYEDSLQKEFIKSLPDKPPWEKSNRCPDDPAEH